MSENLVLEMAYQKIESLRSEIKLIIITATAIETKTVLNSFKPLNSKNEIYKTYHGNQTYHIGVFGEYLAAHVQCNMGSIGIGASKSTVNDICSSFDPSLVIMIGISFGIDEAKQSVGDVLISEYIIPYDSKRVGAESTVARAPNYIAGTKILNRAKNFDANSIKDFQHKINIGPILSGETLVDNIEHRNELKKQFPNCIGGEMEGAGFASELTVKRIEWLLVKSICDFADGNKAKNKQENQSIAAKSAVQYCESFLSQIEAFSDVGLMQFKKIKVKNDPNLVLFDAYEKSCAPYYFINELHGSAVEQFNHFNIWIYGESGVGKTTLVLNHISSQPNTRYIGLAGTIGNSGVETLRSFCYEVCSMFEKPKYLEWSKFSKEEFLNVTVETVRKYSSQEESYILYTDEIPLSDENEFKFFIQGLIAFIILCNQRLPKGQVKFIFTTIHSPLKHIDETQNKIKESFSFIQGNLWSESDIKAFCLKISYWLDENLAETEVSEIVSAAKGRPRFVKRLFRNKLLGSAHTTSDLIQKTHRDIS